MPTTSIEALSELQQRGIDTLKVARNAQITVLRAASESATTPPMLPMARYAADVAISLTYGIIAQQAAFAKRCLDAFSAASPTKASQTAAATIAAAATINETAPAAIDAPPSVDSALPEVSVGLALPDGAVAESGPPAILTPPFPEDVAHDIISASAATTAFAEHLTTDVVDAATSQIENATATTTEAAATAAGDHPIVETAPTARDDYPILETAPSAMDDYPILETAPTAMDDYPILEPAARAAEVSHELVTATSVPSFSEAAAMNDGSVGADDAATGSSRPEIVIPRKVPAVSNNGMQPKRGAARKSKRQR